ncbi:MAG: response regulator [Nitrospiraceae bacterium]|nr:MAG: response regulator [Nitrospiraceae bacterium]
MLIDYKNKKILIIDDFSSFRRLMIRMLESFGAKNIDDAYSGDVAIQKMQDKAYDIILCDYNLGHDKKDGQQILEEAKHRNLIRYSSIFIMLTAENTMPMVMGAVEYQPDDYMIKPITKEMLTRRLEKNIKRKADFEEIENAIRSKEYMRAISLCEERAKNNPRYMLEYLRLKGDLCITTGLYDQAVSVFNEVLAMREIPWAKMGMGKVHFHREEYLMAIDMFRSVLDENKTYMEAYDWLAKTLQELGSLEEAQQVLLTATEISPKAILRHQTIGDISYKIDDYDTAEKAFKSAITIGKHSCFKSPSYYTGLARTMIKKDSSDEALTVLGSARNEFKANREALFQTVAMQGVVYKELNREEEAKKAIHEATRLLEKLSGRIPVDASLDLARVCFDLGEKDKGMEFVQNVVKNNHDNDKVLGMVQEVFRDARLEEEGADIVAAAKKEVIQMNNQGVGLIEEGKLKEAIEYFEKAAKGLPENKIINANAAQAFIMYMQKTGANDRYLYLASQFLDRIKNIDPSYDKYQKLLNMYERVAVSGKSPVG